MASNLLSWTSFPYCGPTAEPCPTGATIRLDPKDFVKGKAQPAALTAPGSVTKDTEAFSCLPSVSAAAMAAAEEVHFRPLDCAEPISPEAERGESTTCTQVSVPRSHSGMCQADSALEPEPEELFLDDDAASQHSPSASLTHFLDATRKSAEDMRRSCGRPLGYGPSPVSSISPVSYQPVGDVPLNVQSEGLLEVAAADMEGDTADVDQGDTAEDDADEAVLVKESDVVEQSASSRTARSRSMPVDMGRVQEFDKVIGFSALEGPQEHPGDIVVDDAMAIEEPDEPDLDDQESGALAIANSHLKSIEAELRAHRDLISQEVEARRRLEDALQAERRRAETEAQGRRKLEQEIEAEKQRIEDERRRKIEEAEMAARREEERRLEEELEAARRRAEEEARLAAQRSEEQQRQAEKRRQLQEMEMKARESAAEAKKERESREKAKAFLAAEGYRHVRAAHKWCPVATYPLHRAVQCNNASMVRLLLWMGADPAKSNTFGQSPLGLAKWLNRRDSHAEVIEALSVQSRQ